jgi:hypothetical protein
VLAASIIRAIITLMMEAASTSETSVNFYQTTRHNNPEDSHLQALYHCGTVHADEDCTDETSFRENGALGEQNITIGKLLNLWKGHACFKQYIPLKLAQFRI